MPSATFLLNEKGASVWMENVYSPGAVTGVSILVVAAALSLVAALGMLTAIIISSFQTNHAFIRSHLGAYFVSLVLAELVQATGSLMSARWIMQHKVNSGPFCAAQGALKNAGNVSTALWSMIIAIHTFTLIFLKVRVPSWAFYSTLVAVWLLVGFVVLLGPAVLQRPEKGPFWGVSGYWCWITGEYETEQFAMEYLFMATTAILSLILYTLIFLRLRGNIDGTGFRISFCRTSTPWQRVANMADPQVERVGKKMLLYPLCYVILVFPIGICRWSTTYGVHVPFPVTIFADSVFLLSGVVNAILYSTTRRVAPMSTIIPTHSSRKPQTEKTIESYQSNLGSPYRSPMLAYVPFPQQPFTPSLPAVAENGYPLTHTSHLERHAPSARSLSTDLTHTSVGDSGIPGPAVQIAVPSPGVPSYIMPPAELELRLAAEGLRASPHRFPTRSSTFDFPSRLPERPRQLDRDWV